ncbi:unnamed protein product, partial [Prorocentrum cordatum]
MSRECGGTVGRCHAKPADRVRGGVCQRCLDKSAAHIQAWARGRRDRRRVAGMRRHKRHLDRMARRIQRWVGTWSSIVLLRQRRGSQRAEAAAAAAATSIQK